MIKFNNGTITVVATVKKIFPLEQKNGGFQIRKVWIEFDSENSNYPHQILLEQTDSKIGLVDQLQENKKYSFFIDFRVREWQDTAFFRASARKIENIENENQKSDDVELPF